MHPLRPKRVGTTHNLTSHHTTDFEMNTPRLSQDILKIFPYEVWSKCISIAIYQEPEGPLPFLGVSSHWQKLLLDAPEMWTYIHIDNKEDFEARVHTFLHLSGRQPLDMAIYFDSSTWQTVRSVIALHRERIHSIHVLEWPFGTERQTISALLEDFTFPEVRTINYHPSWTHASDLGPLLALCPNWQYGVGKIFYGNNMDNKWIKEGLRAITVDIGRKPLGSVEVLLKPYLGLQHLEYIDLYITLESDKDPPSPEVARPEAFILSSKTLRELRIYTSVLQATQGLLSSSLRYLHSLSITTSPSQFNLIIGAFPSLPSLYFVQIDLAFEETNPRTFSRLQSSDIPYVREFSISSQLNPTIDGIFDSLTEYDALVGVEVFKLKFGNYSGGRVQPFALRQLLHSLRNCTHIELGTLQLDYATTESDNRMVSSIRMPKLLRLDVTLSTPVSLIDAPLLHSLRLLDSFIPDVPDTVNDFGHALSSTEISSDAFDQVMVQQFDRWNSVQNITWGSCESFNGLKTIGFQSIRSVEFRGDNYETYDQTRAFNSLLIALLRYPDSCPQLQEIKSGEYPLWQLLLQVLLRRNGNTDLAEIQDIIIPGLPILPLLTIVVAALNGKKSVFIPRNVDDIILRRFKHPVVAACCLCVSSGYIQCPYNPEFPEDHSSRWLQWGRDGSMHDKRRDADYLELLELPADLLPLRADDQEGNMSWKEWQAHVERMTAECKGILRRSHCHGGRQKLVRIHKYLLSD